MELFRYKADRIPVFLFATLSALDLIVYFTCESVPFLLIWFILTLGPKICICSWNHHHQHLPTFKTTLANRALELLYTFHTGITTNAWVLHHNLGHHVNYLDQTKDESRWARKDGSTMGPIEYTLHLAITGYFVAYSVGKKHPRFQKGFLQMGVISTLIIGAMLWYNWVNTIFVFLLPMLSGYVYTCWHTYWHHAGLHTDDHLEASYNVMDHWYNLVTGNLGYHTAHHMKQGLHWSKLPEFHATIAHNIPRHLYREPSIPFRWIPGRWDREERLAQAA